MAQKTVREIRQSFIRWLVGVVLGPIVVMAAIYLICVVLKFPDPFVSNFGAADAIATAAMMMIALGQDILEIPEEEKHGWLAVLNSESLPYICMVLWMIYGAFKIVSIGLGTSDADKEKLLVIATVSILVALCVATYGLYVRYSVMALQLSKK